MVNVNDNVTSNSCSYSLGLSDDDLSKLGKHIFTCVTKALRMLTYLLNGVPILTKGFERIHRK